MIPPCHLIAMAASRNKTMIMLVAILAPLFVPVASAAEQDGVQLLYPDNSVSSKPIVEFRARTDTVLGHAFVALGRELDNGTTFFYAIGGFYPEEGGKLSKLQNILNGPGEVTYKWADVRSDKIFRANITDEQERTIKFIMKHWNGTDYRLLDQNCTTLIKDTAASLGLKVDPKALRPGSVIVSIIEQNRMDRPLEFALEEAKRKQGVSKQNARDQQDTSARIGKAERRRQEAINSMPIFPPAHLPLSDPALRPMEPPYRPPPAAPVPPRLPQPNVQDAPVRPPS